MSLKFLQGDWVIVSQMVMWRLHKNGVLGIEMKDNQTIYFGVRIKLYSKSFNWKFSINGTWDEIIIILGSSSSSSLGNSWFLAKPRSVVVHNACISQGRKQINEMRRRLQIWRDINNDANNGHGERGFQNKKMYTLYSVS